MSKVPKNPETLNKCICPDCPSYNDCMKEKMERLYCATEIGKTNCEVNKKGCICGGCPIHKEFGLNKWYYCVNGPEE